MKLKDIFISSFRNISQANLVPHNRFNILYGMNAQGKTNILESIFLLGTMKSFRMAKSADLVTWGEENALIKGTVEKDDVSREISLLIGKEGKKVRIDRKPVSKISDFFGAINSVVFSPEEITMVRGAPDLRRRYLDRAVFSCDIVYLSIYHEFYRLLKHRNVMLRRGEREGLEIWNEQLAESGARLMARRNSYVEGIRPLLQDFYRKIAQSSDEADIGYQPNVSCFGTDTTATATAMLEMMQRREAEEFRRGTTLVGPHRDDMDFLLDGRMLKIHGSQGQQRSFILALKMAEIEYLHQAHGAPPVLLLDDMTSELDAERNRNLMDYLNSKTMQVFITTTDLSNIRLNGMDDFTGFLVENGVVTKKR